MDLSTRFLLIRLWAFNLLCIILRLENPVESVLRKASNEINGLRNQVSYMNTKLEAAKITIREQEITIARLDRSTSLDVRSSLELLNFETMGEIVWIKVSDDRMLRNDVFNQIRDWMRSNHPHSILMVTGTNVEFNTLTEQDLENAKLRRLTPEECEQRLINY